MKTIPLLATLLLIILQLGACSSSQKKFENDAYQVSIAGYSDGTCDVVIDGSKFISRKTSTGRHVIREHLVLLSCRNMDSSNSKKAYVSFDGELNIEEKFIITNFDKSSDVIAVLGGSGLAGRYTPLNHATPLFSNLEMDLYEYKILYDPDAEPPITLSGLGRRGDHP